MNKKLMKKWISRGLGLSMAILPLGGFVQLASISFASELPSGSAGVEADSNYSHTEMLTYAIEDEYNAQAAYNAILKANGNVRPFSNIVKAEATHVSYLIPLFATYKVALPKDTAVAIAPQTLAEAYALGVKAEVANIAMYETFLKQDLPADVKLVFEALKKASENHLRAFQNAENRGGGFGYGRQR